MRTKLTALLTACAALVAGAVAQAAPVPVAQFTFATNADVGGFLSVGTGKCTKKFRAMGITAPTKGTKKGTNNQTQGGNTGQTAATPPTPAAPASGSMSVQLGAGTNACVLQTSVVADSSDVAPDQIVSATVGLGAGGTPKLQRKAYQGVTVRRNEAAGYELRVFPGAQKWQVTRDPKGPGPIAILQAGSSGSIKGGMKPNAIVLRAFDFGTASTQLSATINGQSVFSTTDAATDQPDGRRNGVITGVKGTGAGTGIVGLFDDVTISVPNPF